MLAVYLDTSPLKSAHASRGVGTYTRELRKSLTEYRSVSLVDKISQAQVVHYPHFDLFAKTLPKHKQPTVVTIHDVIPLLFPEGYKVGVKGKLALRTQKKRLQSVAAVITDSSSSAADITTHLNVPAYKVFVVPLAASTQFTSASTTEQKRVRRKYSLPTQYCLYVGDINFNKNVPQVIKMLKYLPWNVKLVLLGKNFVPQEIPEWKAITTQLALSDVQKRVIFLPTVASEELSDLAAIYTGAVCYVQPSLYEGFGLPVLEAMQCGTPVVASRTSSLPEVVGEAGILVEPTAEELATGVKQILNLKQNERRAMISQGKARARRFNWHKVAEKTVAVYRHAAAQK